MKPILFSFLFLLSPFSAWSENVEFEVEGENIEYFNCYDNSTDEIAIESPVDKAIEALGPLFGSMTFRDSSGYIFEPLELADEAGVIQAIRATAGNETDPILISVQDGKEKIGTIEDDISINLEVWVEGTKFGDALENSVTVEIVYPDPNYILSPLQVLCVPVPAPGLG